MLTFNEHRYYSRLNVPSLKVDLKYSLISRETFCVDNKAIIILQKTRVTFTLSSLSLSLSFCDTFKLKFFLIKKDIARTTTFSFCAKKRLLVKRRIGCRQWQDVESLTLSWSVARQITGRKRSRGGL